MATLPNTNITAVPPEAPEDAEFPTPDPINTFDLVGPTAANRQPGAFKTRDNTLRQRVNELLENMNEISTGDAVDSAVLFLPRDGTNPMTGNLDLGGKAITGWGLLLATPTSTPDDYVQVSAGTYQKTTGKGYQDVNAQSVQIITSVGGGQTRYDLVHIDDLGNLTATQGVAGTPGLVPEFPDDELMLAIIKVDETGAIVVDASDITDVRPFLSADQNARTLQTEPIDNASPNSGDILQYDGSKWGPEAVVSLPTNYIGGLITSNGTDVAKDIDIAKGQCRDVDDTENLVLSSVLTKQTDAVWAVGTDQGGLDEGSAVADQLYLLWLIKRTDTGVVDAIFSILGLLEKVTTVDVSSVDDSYNDATEDLSIFKVGQKVWVEGFTDGANNGLKTVLTSSANKITVSETLVTEAAGDTVTFTAQVTSPKMPTNYDKRRLIAAMRTDGSVNVLAYVQSGDYFRYTGDVIPDVADTDMVSDTWKTGTLSVPPKCVALVYAASENGSTTGGLGYVGIRYKGAVDASPLEASAYQSTAGDTFVATGGRSSVLLDSSRQMEYMAYESDGTSSVRIQTFGFIMFTRREP